MTGTDGITVRVMTGRTPLGRRRFERPPDQAP